MTDFQKDAPLHVSTARQEHLRVCPKQLGNVLHGQILPTSEDSYYPTQVATNHANNFAPVGELDNNDKEGNDNLPSSLVDDYYSANFEESIQTVFQDSFDIWSTLENQPSQSDNFLCPAQAQ